MYNGDRVTRYMCWLNPGSSDKMGGERGVRRLRDRSERGEKDSGRVPERGEKDRKIVGEYTTI